MARKILDPLVTKFILPEHAEMLRQYHEDKKLIRKSIIEEDELAEFCYKISDSRHSMTILLQLAGGKKRMRVEE
ncbi:hypothetical protein BRLA_c031680 [Brevibacillus laterosporus LMG 15441]|uniref:Uncharacterized protein n=1 Tax=Brevibacillus laterosporus LMG 15441 TaxID=1042163 RepID=A0A075RDJ1_BRELA|nr:hypothetical protein BRLA_c031680 [Brevibacillus laterosporus LMG 15441]